MLQLQYGGHLHNPGECAVQRRVTPEMSRAGVVLGVRETWQIQGEIVDDGGPTAIASKLAAIEAAYKIQGQDLQLLDESSNVVLSLPSSTSISGTRTTIPSLPNGTGAEWATGLKYELTVEADYSTVLDSTVLIFQETYTMSGGGPVHAWRQPLVGAPIAQQVAAASPFRLVQQGFAIGRGLYPTTPTPLFPAALWSNPEIRKVGPGQYTGQLKPVNYRIEWTYRMESASPLTV